VNFRSRNQPKDTDSQFTLQLSKKMKYDVVAKKVGETIGITPDKVCFIFFFFLSKIQKKKKNQ